MAFVCDFHVHSTCSDGSLSPRALVDEALRQGVAVFALTDHDTTRGLAEAQAAGRAAGVEVWGGIELSVCEDEARRQMHILGLGIDPSHPELNACVEAFRAQRRERGERIVERLARAGVRLDFERVRALAHDGSIGRPHVARALVEAGICRDAEEAFHRFLRLGRPAYLPREGPSAARAIALIHAAGGIASLAHPRLSVGVDGRGGLEAFIARLVPLGLDALEVDHPSHTPPLRRRLRRYARQYGLVCTGGSDFHGEERPDVALGRGRGEERLGRRIYDAIQERLARRRAGSVDPPGARA